MATGTDIGMQTAGVTLMRGDPALVAEAVKDPAPTAAKIRQNLFWAFVYNAVGIPLAVLGLSPVLAGAAMAASSVSVVTNARFLLRRWRAEEARRLTGDACQRPA